MTEKTITITIHKETADRLREAQAAEPKRIDWTGFSWALDDERRQK